MIEYIQEVLGQMERNAEDASASEGDKAQNLEMIVSMQANLEKLKPVIDAHDKDYHDLQHRELEMERLLHEFKNSLMIEKIKMDTWENKQKLKHK